MEMTTFTIETGDSEVACVTHYIKDIADTFMDRETAN